MYEPQPESLSGNKLTGRAAVSVRKSGDAEPVFGVVFFTATLQSGGSGNEISAMQITQAKFSGMDDQNTIDDYSSLLEKNANGWDLGMSNKDLEDAVAREKNAGENFRNAAPRMTDLNERSFIKLFSGIAVRSKHPSPRSLRSLR